MPKVPVYDRPQVDPSGMPGQRAAISDIRLMQLRAGAPAAPQGMEVQALRGRRQSQADLPAVRPDIPEPVQPVDNGRMYQVLGQHITQAGTAALDIFTKLAQQQNHVRVVAAADDVQKRAVQLTYDKTEGYQSRRGIDAMPQGDKKPLADEYHGLLQDHITKVREGLANDAQRDLFDRETTSIVQRLYAGALSHEAEQSRQYGLATAAGRVELAQQQVGLSYHDTAALDDSLKRIGEGTALEFDLRGQSAPGLVEAETRKRQSQAIRGAVGAALQDRQPAMAKGLLDKYGPMMDVNDLTAVRGAVDRELSLSAGLGAAGAVWDRSQPQTPFDALHSALIGQESGGQQTGKDGQVLTSKAGALGVGQFMPDTAREVAQQHNIPFDLERLKTDREYNYQLSRLHLQDLLQTFGGDPAKALAAYNAGEGDAQKGTGVRGAEAKAAAAGNPGAWLDYMPAETRAYVPSIMSKAQRATGQRPTLADMDQQLRSDPVLASRPDALAQAQQELTRRASLDAQAAKQREAEAVNAALEALRQNGGNWAALSPAIRNAIPADKLVDLQSQAGRMAAGIPVKTDMALYGGLVAHPEQLASMDEASFKALETRIADGDMRHLADLRAKQINPTQTDSKDPGNLDNAAIKNVVDVRLTTLGIDPTPAPKDMKEGARVGAIRQYINQSLLDAQRGAGRRFNEAEIADHVDKLFSRNATKSGWFSDSSAPVLTMKAGDIPSEARDGIKEGLRRAGISDPTDGQVLAKYYEIMGRTR